MTSFRDGLQDHLAPLTKLVDMNEVERPRSRRLKHFHFTYYLTLSHVALATCKRNWEIQSHFEYGWREPEMRMSLKRFPVHGQQPREELNLR